MSSPETGPFPRGQRISLDGLHQMPQFEDMLAAEIQPRMTEGDKLQWAGRSALRDALYPAKFNGSIADIQFEVMETPLEKLVSARDRGLKFSYHTAQQRVIDNFEHYLSEGRAFGMSYYAHARSSGRGVVGDIYAELWYYPSTHTQMYTGRTGIQRLITKPQYDKELFANHEIDARAVGFVALQHAMHDATVQGLHN